MIPKRTTLPALMCLGLLTAFAPAQAAEPDWSPLIQMDQQIFPSLLIATATIRFPGSSDDPDPFLLGDQAGQIGVTLKSPAGPAPRIKVTVTADDIAEPSVIETTLPKAAGTYQIFPKIKYKYRALLDVRQKMPVNVTIDVAINDKPAGSQTVTVTLRSINDCPYWIENPPTAGDSSDAAGSDRANSKNDKSANKAIHAHTAKPRSHAPPPADSGSSADAAGPDSDDSGTDLSWMFAAYVNEDHPYIDNILKDALASGLVNEFDGYQSDDPARVSLQVLAIWQTLQKRGIKYSDVTAHGGRNTIVYSQHVRFLDESLDALQANCVDGSVLLASVLRKIGIEPFLLTTPGHMYLGYYLDKSHKKAIALETTMMGDKEIDEFEEIDGLSDLVPDKFRKLISYKSFNAAAQAGTRDMKANSKKFNTESEYQLISIAEARKMGIAPIAYRKK